MEGSGEVNHIHFHGSVFKESIQMFKIREGTVKGSKSKLETKQKIKLRRKGTERKRGSR